MRNEIQVPYASLACGPGGRAFLANNLAVYREGAIARGQLEVITDFTWVAMDRVVKLESRRRDLIGDDQLFIAATSPLMSRWLAKTHEIQAGLFQAQNGNPYGGQW
ncbi:hypothetical protein [Lentzea sp. NPDC051838]|uniref:hypothetical protein n=1 Tax=Lentzea sp. NPDC051838 TaxID=3154849 RepID=UPI003437ABDD